MPGPLDYGSSAGYPSASPILPVTYTVATLPPAANYPRQYCWVTDLGGGADFVLSDGVNWKHIRRGIIGSVALAANIPLTPLVSNTIVQITGTGVAALTTTINLAATNLYPGYELTIKRPGALGAAASMGISIGGGVALPILGASWTDFTVDATGALQAVRTGSISS